jgi:hypothetical protein
MGGTSMKISTSIIGLFLIGVLLIGGSKPISANNHQQDFKQVYHQMLNSIQPSYQNEKKISHYPPDFQIYDLVFFDSTFPPGRWNVRGFDHIAIYLGNDSFLCTTHNKTTQVGEVNIVSYNDLFQSWMLKNPQYARVINATPDQRHAATEWALSRIGDLYQTWDPRKVADPNSSIITADQWYCSEIVWAAYYNIGIDIDRNGWTRDFPWFFPLCASVSPQDIYDDNDVIHLL